MAPSAIQLLQFTTLGLVIAASVLTAYQIARRTPTGLVGVSVCRGFAPYLAALTLFGLLNLYLFTLPMAHRV